MHYKWIGAKPHRRTVLKSGGARSNDWSIQEIKPGEVFEPTDGELKSFKDLLEPIGAGLAVAAESDAGRKRS
jgi:hypothetical protein